MCFVHFKLQDRGSVDLCWQRTVSNEAFQYRTIFKYIILYWAFQVRHHPKCRYQTRRPNVLLLTPYRFPILKMLIFRTWVDNFPRTYVLIHIPPFSLSLIHQSTFTSTVVHSLCAPVSQYHPTLFQNPCTSVLRSYTSLFHNPCTVHEHKVSYTYRQQANIRHIDRLM